MTCDLRSILQASLLKKKKKKKKEKKGRFDKIAILKHKRQRKFEFFSVISICISLMNTKSGIFLVATFGVHQ